MIIYGVRVFNKILGYFGEVCECENCHNKYKKRLLKTSKWMHIMFIPFCPFGSKYKEICPICYQQKNITKKEARELKKNPDTSGQDIETYVLHHANDKNGYEIWTRDVNGSLNECVLNKLNKTQIKNFKKNMGLKNFAIKEID